MRFPGPARPHPTSKILVTGGAGFIGSNYVLDWLGLGGEPVVNLDKLTYAGNLGNLAGLRFFTVYGPWGRPDQAPMLFTAAILAGKPITVFNHGRMQRDFTYVDDIVEGVLRVLERPPAGDEAGGARHAVYNIGNHQAVELETFIATLERLLGRTAIRDYRPMQPGDVPATYASIDRLHAATGFAPRTPLADGLARFVAWYRDYHGECPRADASMAPARAPLRR